MALPGFLFIFFRLPSCQPSDDVGNTLKVSIRQHRARWKAKASIEEVFAGAIAVIGGLPENGLQVHGFP